MVKILKKKHRKYDPYEDLLKEEEAYLEKKNLLREGNEHELLEDIEGETFNEENFQHELKDMEKSTLFYELSYIEMLKEKKVNLKERGLISLIKLLQQNKAMNKEEDCFKNHYEEFTLILGDFLRRPDNYNEMILSLKLICLLGLYYAPDNDEFVCSFYETLEEIIFSSEEMKKDVAPQCLFTYCFLCFLSKNYDCIIRGLDIIERLFRIHFISVEDLSCDLFEQAVESWILLSSTLEIDEILERCQEVDLFENLMQVLIRNRSNFNKSSSLNIMIGRCLAYLWECVEEKFETERIVSGLTLEEEQMDVFEEIDDGKMMRYCEELSMNPREIFIDLKNLKEFLFFNTKKLSKVEKKMEKIEFREIFQFIFYNCHLEDRISMIGNDFYINSFLREIKVGYLKKILENGFQSCFQVYPITIEILDADFINFEVGQEERRRHRIVTKRSKESRRRTVERKKERKSTLGFYAEKSLIFTY